MMNVNNRTSQYGSQKLKFASVYGGTLIRMICTPGR